MRHWGSDRAKEPGDGARDMLLMLKTYSTSDDELLNHRVQIEQTVLPTSRVRSRGEATPDVVNCKEPCVSEEISREKKQKVHEVIVFPPASQSQGPSCATGDSRLSTPRSKVMSSIPIVLGGPNSSGKAGVSILTQSNGGELMKVAPGCSGERKVDGLCSFKPSSSKNAEATQDLHDQCIDAGLGKEEFEKKVIELDGDGMQAPSVTELALSHVKEFVALSKELIAKLQGQVATLEEKVAVKELQVATLEEQVTYLKTTVADLNSQIRTCSQDRHKGPCISEELSRQKKRQNGHEVATPTLQGPRSSPTQGLCQDHLGVESLLFKSEDILEESSCEKSEARQDLRVQLKEKDLVIESLKMKVGEKDLVIEMLNKKVWELMALVDSSHKGQCEKKDLEIQKLKKEVGELQDLEKNSSRKDYMLIQELNAQLREKDESNKELRKKVDELLKEKNRAYADGRKVCLVEVEPLLHAYKESNTLLKEHVAADKDRIAGLMEMLASADNFIAKLEEFVACLEERGALMDDQVTCLRSLVAALDTMGTLQVSTSS